MITIVSSRVCADQQELLEEKEDEEAALYRGVAPGESLSWLGCALVIPAGNSTLLRDTTGNDPCVDDLPIENVNVLMAMLNHQRKPDGISH